MFRCVALTLKPADNLTFVFNIVEADLITRNNIGFRAQNRARSIAGIDQRIGHTGMVHIANKAMRLTMLWIELESASV